MKMLTQRELVRNGKVDYWTPFDEMEEYLRRFPWLRNPPTGGKTLQVHAGLLTREICEYSPATYIEFESISLLNDTSGEKIFLLDYKGDTVVRTSVWERREKKFWFFGPLVSRRREFRSKGEVDSQSTIRDAASLLREEARHVRYALSWFPYTRAAIVYEVPFGISLRDVIEGKTSPSFCC